MNRVPEQRIMRLNGEPVRAQGSYVLYWMNAARRTRWNWALQRAVELARDLDRPLVVLEALRCGYRWASDRHHRFILEGMADNQSRLEAAGVTSYAYAESADGEGSGLVAALARTAAVVVTDDWPCFFLPHAVERAAAQVGVAMEKVDANGIVPMAALDRVFVRAHDYRRWFQRWGRHYLHELPSADPLAALRNRTGVDLPPDITKRWPRAERSMLAAEPAALARLPIDHGVRPVALRGGSGAAERRLSRFLDRRLEGYAETRSRPEEEGTSGLSPYLHHGHVSAHEVAAAVLDGESWTSDRLGPEVRGARSGWWGVSPGAEAFLDQLVTWRELGFNMCSKRADHDRYESLPEWARCTLAEHAADPRPHVYTLGELAEAGTHDELWNAAQRQLVAEGCIHGHLRMLWGKKILEWSPSPREALAAMIELNDRYALDGRDPNSYGGIFWVLGRYDRPWGPERPVFGKIRYMASESTARKMRVRGYIERYSATNLRAP